MSADPILYLSAREVASALQTIDPIDAVTSAFAAHARGETVLPAEAYLGWGHAGQTLRSLSMPALVDGAAGVKIINANPSNLSRGLPRASGLTVLFDIETGRPICVLEGARISLLRTAAVTAVAAQLLGAHPIKRLALLGAGALARCHVEVLTRQLPNLREIRIYDIDTRRAAALAADTHQAVVCESSETAIHGAQLVIPMTTTTSGYIRHSWLEPGSLLVNVSLDDPLPEVVRHADKVFVDDWALITADKHRLLGRMFRAGHLRAPDSPAPDNPANGSRAIDGELGQLVIGARLGRARSDEIILVNPFGLALQDIAIARRVYHHALQLDLGTALER